MPVRPISVNTAEQLTTAATYVRQAVVRQLRQDGLLNPSEQVQR